MTPDQLKDGIKEGFQKSLEVWTLQSLCDIAILAGFAALALIAAHACLERKGQQMLRISREQWSLRTGLGADILLAVVGLVAMLVTNLDIMADIKIALPWVPLGFLLMMAALVIRLFHGGHVVASKAWCVALVLVGLGCLSTWFGFTFVMEGGAGEEYKDVLTSTHGIWEALENMRSDKNPGLAVATFIWAGPALMLTFAWAIVAGAIHTMRWARQKQADQPGKSV